MSSIVISGDTSGTVTLSAPAVAGSTTQTLVNVTGTLAPLVSATAVASTSGTAIDFTGIPSWVKRITVMFNAVSTSGTSPIQVQIGVSGTAETSGYDSAATLLVNTGTAITNRSTAGFIIDPTNATYITAATVRQGFLTLTNLSGNTWVANGSYGASSASAIVNTFGGGKTLAGVLNMVRVTTANGTDTFDAGSINIMYE